MNKRLEEKIEESIKIFKSAYPTYGFGYGNTNSPNYARLLNSDGTSKVVGNSSFSPRIRMLPVYYPGQTYGIPHHYRWVLSVHPKLADGIKEEVIPDMIHEIEIDCMQLDRIGLDKVREFLRLSNKEIMEMFKIPYNIFSEESRKIMEDVDRRNELLYKTQESLEEFKANNCKVKNDEEKELREERIVS